MSNSAGNAKDSETHLRYSRYSAGPDRGGMAYQRTAAVIQKLLGQAYSRRADGRVVFTLVTRGRKVQGPAGTDETDGVMRRLGRLGSLTGERGELKEEAKR